MLPFHGISPFRQIHLLVSVIYVVNLFSFLHLPDNFPNKDSWSFRFRNKGGLEVWKRWYSQRVMPYFKSLECHRHLLWTFELLFLQSGGMGSRVYTSKLFGETAVAPRKSNEAAQLSRIRRNLDLLHDLNLFIVYGHSGLLDAVLEHLDLRII